MIVGEDDEVLVVMERGKVVRSSVTGVPAKGRDTMGVVFAKPDSGDRIIAVARNSERSVEEELAGDEESVTDSEASSTTNGGAPGDSMASDQGDSIPGAGGGDDQERSDDVP
jgi:DNA gyrase subunit A